jgi:uncharacterized protein YvpB
LNHFLEFVKYGGKIKIAIPVAKDVEKEIEQKRPVFAITTTNFLTDFKLKTGPKKSQFNSHFNIVTGIDGKFIYVNDPLPDKRGGQQKYKISDYFFGIYANAYSAADNASLMLIKKV